MRIARGGRGRQAHLFEHGGDLAPPFGRGRRRIRKMKRLRDQTLHRPLRIKTAVRILEHRLDPAPQSRRRPALRRRESFAQQPDLSRLRQIQCQDDPEQARFTGPRLSDQPHRFTRMNRQGRAVDGPKCGRRPPKRASLARIFADHVLDFQDRRRGCDAA